MAFNTERFSTLLKTDCLGRDIHYFPSLPSTNTWLKSVRDPEIGEGTLCLTDEQRAGRGQYGRNWVSSQAENLTWSLAFKPEEAESDRLFLLALACVLVAAEAVDAVSAKQTRLKWPNDLIMDGFKIGGVLAEAVFSGTTLDRFIVGIGINVNQKQFPDDLPGASSLARCCSVDFDREALLADILNRTEKRHQQWKSGDMQLPKAINERLIGYGEKLFAEVNGVRDPDPLLVLGVNGNGYLHLMDDEYHVRTYAYEQVRLFTAS